MIDSRLEAGDTFVVDILYVLAVFACNIDRFAFDFGISRLSLPW